MINQQNYDPMIQDRDISSDIAIVSMTGRFPGAKDIDALWQNLQAGVESITRFSDQELLQAGVDPTLLQNPDYVKANGALNDLAGFDASFFDISPREAEILDPQQRLFLECSWMALERAGYDPQRYPGLIGIYAGVGINGYLLNNLMRHQDLLRSVGVYQLLFNNDKDFLPSRVAYKLNLTGAAVNVQTACSTSLVAVHLACQSLLNGETDMVLAGGVSVSVPHHTGYLYREGMIFSPDGHCRAFDARAAGTVGGSGVAIVVLKRLADAIADGDPCHAVIRGSAINNDGSRKVGYTAPSIEGQAAAISEALAVADVEAESIRYIEAHGTGTKLGDPIEIAALKRAFSHQTNQQQFCAIGSLKTNLGHLDTAAGTAGLIKTVLALKHQAIPPSLNFETPNTNIDFDNSPFYVNTCLQAWPRADQPRRAGVSSFGVGGTNAHVIVEEAPLREPSGPARPWQLLLLSAKTPSALAQMTTNLTDFFQEESASELKLADVAYTLGCGRQAFNYRRFLVCQDIDQAIHSLQAVEDKFEEKPTLSSWPQVVTGSGKPEEQSLTFLFPGQGSQHVNMGRDLYQSEPIFRQQVDRCADLLQPLLNLDLRQILYPDPEQEATATAQLQQTAIAQPALFVIEYALAQLWLAWGVSPTAMVGHSIGEYVAACLAEVFSLEAGLALVAKRGQLMQQLPQGTMVAVPLAAEAVQSILGKGSRFKEIAIAVINEPNRCVVSGPKETMAAFEQHLTNQSVEGRRLHTSHAFHSPMMEPILDAFRQQCQQVAFQPPQRPYLSNLTGTWITNDQATDPDYWVQHLRQPVQFSQSLTQLCHNADQPQILLEVGPGRVLSSLAQRHPASQGHPAIATLRHPREDKSDVATSLSALGQLWLQGTEIDWPAVYGQERRHRLALPTYPFEHERYWIEASDATMVAPVSQPEHWEQRQETGSHRRDFKDWFYLPSWSRRPIPPVKRGAQAVTDTILVFVDDVSLAAPLTKKMVRDDRTIVQVQIGETFQSLGENHYSLNPQYQEDYGHLFQSLNHLGQRPDKILHLWTLIPDEQVSDQVQSTDQSLALGFYSLLFLAQAWNKQGFDQPCDLVLITQHLHRVTGEEHLLPNQSTLLGAIRTIPQEIPGLTCRCVDILLSGLGSQLDVGLEPSSSLIHQLVTEVEAPAGEPENQAIAYRGPYRWVQQFETFPMELETQGENLLKPEGVYLITGGLGGLGLNLAQHLAQHWQARLVLLSRSSFPQESDWQDWLENHSLDHPISLKIQALQALKKAGAEVLVVTADVCDRTSLQEAITTAINRFGVIHGVIHTAGLPGGGVIDLRTQAEATAVFQPKLQGTLNLDHTLQALNKQSLDFMVLCSSVTAITGAVGQIDYCAANAFLDAYAQARNVNSPTRYLAINWESLQQVGMAAKALETLSERLAGDPSNHWLLDQMRSELALGLFPADCGQVLERLLGQAEPQVIVSTRELNPRLMAQRRMGDNPAQHQPAANPSIKFPVVNASDDPVENKVIGILQALLGRDTISVNDNFFELGGDSLVGMQFLAHLRQTFAIDLAIATVFEASTITQLATVIKAKQQSSTAGSFSTELSHLEDILDQVDDLSEEELDALSRP